MIAKCSEDIASESYTTRGDDASGTKHLGANLCPKKWRRYIGNTGYGWTIFFNISLKSLGDLSEVDSFYPE